MNSSSLEFQNFDLGNDNDSTIIDINPSKPQKLLHSPDRISLAEPESDKSNSKSFWTFEYYQQFFDVNTDEVKERIIWAMIPRPGRNYLENCLKPNPDLYGPFWICTTLIFTIAVSGNVANYLQYAPTSAGDFKWKYDFHMISYAATAIFSYACIVPILLYTFMKWNNTIVTLSFLELLCAYGYSLSIYVPVSILSVIQFPLIQWGVIIIGSLLSVFTLVTSVGSSVEGPKKIPSVLIVITLHFLLAAGFLIYAFNVPVVSMGAIPTAATPSSAAPSINGTMIEQKTH